MARKKSTAPKREAKQARSKATIEVILTAAGLVIEEHGYQAATTDRIAARAGVSVGSIYQYFSNKDEIFERFLAREENKLTESLSRALAFQGQNNRLRLSMFIRTGASPEYLGPKVYYELSRIPSLEEPIRHLQSAVIEVTSNLIQSIRPDLPIEAVGTYAVLLVTTAQGFGAASETGPDEVLLGTYIEMFENFLLPDKKTD